MTPERAIAAFWLACTEDGGLHGVALNDAMLKLATPPAAQQESSQPLCVGRRFRRG